MDLEQKIKKARKVVKALFGLVLEIGTLVGVVKLVIESIF